jgi:DNA-binding NarL/FixJ family response regulator
VPTGGDKVRLLIVAAHPVVRAGLRHTFQDREDLEIVGESTCASDAAAVAQVARPDVILVDPDSEEVGLRAVAALAQFAEGRILVVTASVDPKVHARAMELGALGVMSKHHPVDLLRRAVDKLGAGEVWLERGKTAAVLRHVMRRAQDPEAEKIAALTKREREIVALVGEGLKNAAIANRLFISEATVRNHLTSILSKLALSDRFELAVYAHRHELVAGAWPMAERAAG